VSEPHKWDRTVAPLTSRRLALFIAYRVFSLVVVSAMTVGVLVAALHSPSSSTWTLFGLVALFWVIVVPTYVFVTILLFKVRRSRRSQQDEDQDA
jgi:heme/copper-type cytochrome/quinol oxidase subunit 2